MFLSTLTLVNSLKLKEIKTKICWVVDADRRNFERKPRGYQIESQTFKILYRGANTDWSFSCYPSGNFGDGKENVVAVSLEAYSGFSTISYQYKIGFLDHTKGEASMMKKERLSHRTIIKHDVLFDPLKHFIKDGKLTIVCEVIQVNFLVRICLIVVFVSW